VVSELIGGEVPSTKAAKHTLGALLDDGRVLVVLGRDEENAWLSVRNLTQVHPILADQLNTYDVVVSDHVVFTRSGFDAFVGAAPAAAATSEPSEPSQEETA
jgi:large subunit ribosomal protein L4